MRADEGSSFSSFLFPRAQQQVILVRRLSSLISHLQPSVSQHYPEVVTAASRPIGGSSKQNSLHYRNMINKRQNALVPCYYDSNEDFIQMVVSKYHHQHRF